MLLLNKLSKDGNENNYQQYKTEKKKCHFSKYNHICMDKEKPFNREILSSITLRVILMMDIMYAEMVQGAKMCVCVYVRTKKRKEGERERLIK